MLRRWRSWQGKKIESLLSVGRKARGGATSQDQEMLEQEAGGDVGGSERAGAVFQNFSTHRICQKVFM